MVAQTASMLPPAHPVPWRENQTETVGEGEGERQRTHTDQDTQNTMLMIAQRVHESHEEHEDCPTYQNQNQSEHDENHSQ